MVAGNLSHSFWNTAELLALALSAFLPLLPLIQPPDRSSEGLVVHVCNAREHSDLRSHARVSAPLGQELPSITTPFRQVHVSAGNGTLVLCKRSECS